MRIFPVLACVFAFSSVATPQTATQQTAARATFEQFFALNQAKKLNTASARALVTGEATAYLSRPQIGTFSKVDAFVFTDTTHAVARVQNLSEEGTPTVDVYFYLTRSGSKWTVNALRALALTGMMEMAADELKRKPKLSPKEREELANTLLTLKDDADLRAHFQRNRAAFARLATVKRHPLSSSESAKLRYQLVFDPSPSQSEHGDNLEWVIGGISDNTVGYGYSPDGKLPPISPNETIWVERLSPHWYLFRTT